LTCRFCLVPLPTPGDLGAGHTRTEQVLPARDFPLFVVPRRPIIIAQGGDYDIVAPSDSDAPASVGDPRPAVAPRGRPGSPRRVKALARVRSSRRSGRSLGSGRSRRMMGSRERRSGVVGSSRLSRLGRRADRQSRVRCSSHVCSSFVKIRRSPETDKRWWRVVNAVRHVRHPPPLPQGASRDLQGKDHPRI